MIRGLALCTLVAVAALAIGCGGSGSTTSSTATSAPVAAVPNTPPVADTTTNAAKPVGGKPVTTPVLRQIAAGAAKDMGDTHASVPKVWHATLFQIGKAVVPEQMKNAAASEEMRGMLNAPTDLIVMRGNFHEKRDKSDQKTAMKGPVLAVAVDSATSQVRAFTVLRHVPTKALATLGPSRTLSR
jgi:hypothetical protein